MLVLSRREGENVIIKTTPPVEVVVIEIRGSQVKLGFKAPREVEILRKELDERTPLGQ